MPGGLPVVDEHEKGMSIVEDEEMGRALMAAVLLIVVFVIGAIWAG